MIIYNGFNDKKLHSTPRSVAIGVFDGVHRGHQKILKAALRDARQKHRRMLVVTFDPHPQKVISPEQNVPVLMSLSHRLRHLEKLGVDEVVVVSFDKRFSSIAHDTFLKDLLLRRVGMKFLAVGNDFRFGKHGLGDTAYLAAQASRLGFELSLVDPLKQGQNTISSTRIRRLIEKGLLASASAMLGRPVSVYGDVVRGKGRGRSLGFPTANINPHHETLPPAAVYAARGQLIVGARRAVSLRGVIHIGARPTFHEKERSLEVHFFDFHRDIYGREVELIFVKRLRPIRRFKNVQMLVRAIQKDVQASQRILAR